MSQVSQGMAGRIPVQQVLALPSGCVLGLSQESQCLCQGSCSAELVTH